jgi:hypothetical protein
MAGRHRRFRHPSAISVIELDPDFSQSRTIATEFSVPLVDLNGVERHQHERDQGDTEHNGGDTDVAYQRPRRKQGA